MSVAAQGINKNDKAWLEGIIDMGGSFNFSISWSKRDQRYRYQARITLFKLPLEVARKASRLLGKKFKLNRDKTGYLIELHANQLRVLLPSLNLLSKSKHKKIMLSALCILQERQYAPYSRTMRSDRKLQKLSTGMSVLNGTIAKKTELKINYNRPEPYFGRSPHQRTD